MRVCIFITEIPMLQIHWSGDSVKSLEPSLAKALKALGIQELNEVQKVAEKKGLFNSKESYALMSQSRTGKTFAGILFIANEMFKAISKKKEPVKETCHELGIFIAPFHASARETAAAVSRYFGWFLRPLVLFRGVNESDVVFRLTKGIPPNIIIATPDAFREFLRYDTTREWLSSQKIIATVFDDVHSIIHDPLRGLRLFEISNVIRRLTGSDSRLLVLSAKFREPERLESYFGVKLVQDESHYASPEIELVKYSKTKEKDTSLNSLLEDLADEGTRTLVYMKSIDSITSYLESKGSNLASAVSYDVDTLFLERLQCVASILSEVGYPSPVVFKSGIAVYHGLLSESQRWFVEWAFRRGYLRFLFGTEALGYGVTAPVSHVVMESPGIDEIFRQSMMARAVRLRRGKIRPGKCTVFTRTIADVSALEDVYESPTMPLRFIDDGKLSGLLIGLIGHGVVKSDADRKSVVDNLDLFFKKGSTSKVLKHMMDHDPPFMGDGSQYTLTALGDAVFSSSLDFPIVERILQGLTLLESTRDQPTMMDLLIIANHASILIGRKDKSDSELSESAQRIYLTDYKSALAPMIIDTDLESEWRKAVEFSLILAAGDECCDLDLVTRKSRDRLRRDLTLFLPNLTAFLLHLRELIPVTGLKTTRAIDSLLKILGEKELRDIITDEPLKVEKALRFKDLSFVDFGNIERSIDLTLESDLAPMQKARLIDLLETVQHTTISFVNLLEHQKDSAENREILDLICDFSSEGLVGKNLVKALEEEGVVERGTLDGLWHRFSTEVESIQKRTDAPAKAAKVLFSVFTGDFVGLATSGADAVKIALGRTKKVDTSKLA